MSEKKLSLDALRVSSFVTQARGFNGQTIRGGDTEQVNCQTNTVCTLHTIGGDCYEDGGISVASIDLLCGPSGQLCTQGVPCGHSAAFTCSG